ncbi:MAG: tetratricopeptide repeat protein [Cyanobacteria bacterium SIG26]|nr:tetratricopeptide repeat protein [Cyanobacteria bacterium SIG26]
MRFYKLLKSTIILSVLIGTMSMSYGSIATDAKLQYNKGIDYYQLGQLEESISCFRKAIELDPNYIDAYYNLGSILEYMKQDEAALTVFKQIILRNPNDYDSVLKTAKLSMKLGDFEKAKMYLALIPKDTMTGQEATQLNYIIDKELDKPQNDTKITIEQATNNNQYEPPIETNRFKIYTDITSPTGITTDNNGNIYVAGFSDNTIYKITPDNKKIVYIKDKKIDGPIGLATDKYKNIYIANYNKNNVLKVDTNGEITELMIDIKNPYCLYIVGDKLFVSSQGSNSVIQFQLNQ